MIPDPNLHRFERDPEADPPEGRRPKIRPPRQLKAPRPPGLPTDGAGVAVTRPLPCPCNGCRGLCEGYVLMSATMWIDNRHVRPVLEGVNRAATMLRPDPESEHRSYHLAISPVPDQVTCSNGCVLSAEEWGDASTVAFLTLAHTYGDLLSEMRDDALRALAQEMDRETGRP